MSTTGALVALVELSKVDRSLARIASEQKRSSIGLTEITAKVEALNNVVAAKLKQLTLRKDSCAREEEDIKSEREKLVLRRKAAGTLGGYKVQQAAEREIENLSKMLNGREETLIKDLQDCEQLEKSLTEMQSQHNSLQTEQQAMTRVVDGDNVAFDAEKLSLTAQRQELAKGIAPQFFKVYARICGKFAGDAIVPLNKDTGCSGCFMVLGPQAIVEISRATDLIRCRGCGRILFLEEPAVKN